MHDIARTLEAFTLVATMVLLLAEGVRRLIEDVTKAVRSTPEKKGKLVSSYMRKA